ncbi:hypothetical protein KY310_01920 [Candidatus Woesearchaeota archaeon]|nr:hypothetical protein [Candidatus Woesearchaeota archaeon]
MTHVGEKYALAGDNKDGITNDHFEIFKRNTGDGIKCDGVLRRGHIQGDTPFKYAWQEEQHWFENANYSDACRDGKERAEEAGVVLVEAKPGLVERVVLWHPEGWQPKKEQ